jgi:hypothetical protein
MRSIRYAGASVIQAKKNTWERSIITILSIYFRGRVYLFRLHNIPDTHAFINTNTRTSNSAYTVLIIPYLTS